jgi:hypothetical protein
MYITLGEIAALVGFGLVCVYLFAATRVRELAITAVQRAAQRDDFQLLDQNVHIRRISLSRDDTGRRRNRRQYRFDYSFDGVERLQGNVIMLGNVLQAVVVSEPNVTYH